MLLPPHCIAGLWILSFSHGGINCFAADGPRFPGSLGLPNSDVTPSKLTFKMGRDIPRIPDCTNPAPSYSEQRHMVTMVTLWPKIECDGHVISQDGDFVIDGYGDVV